MFTRNAWVGLLAWVFVGVDARASDEIVVKLPGRCSRAVYQLVSAYSATLFTSLERRRLLREAGISLDEFLQNLHSLPKDVEKPLGGAILEFFKQHSVSQSAKVKAALYEELAFIVDKYRRPWLPDQLPPHRISYNYRWRTRGKVYYLFQGSLTFPKGHYTIVIDSDGTAYYGFANVIRDLSDFKADFEGWKKL